MKYSYLIFLLLFAYVHGIAQNKITPNMRNKKQISPDICLVQARITKIIPARKKISKRSCKQAPCIAHIEIIKIEKTGRTFPVKFTKGQKIKVKFLYSLKPVEDKNLSGLKKGDIFRAAIKAKETQNSKLLEYQIQYYFKL